MKPGKTTRREFVQSAGMLSIGFSLFGAVCWQNQNFLDGMEPNTGPPDDSLINAWIQVLAEGKVKILTGKMELGQGIKTAIMQVAAEELNSDMDLIDIHIAETGITPDEGYTVGSMSIETSAMAVRHAAASARDRLLELASRKYAMDKSTLSLKDLAIIVKERTIPIHELLDGQQIAYPVGTPELILAKTERKIVGKPIPRKDIETMVTGRLHFVHDLRIDGMVHARIVRPPSYSSQLISVDWEAPKGSGFLKLVRIAGFLGVIAEEEYQAIQLATSLRKASVWNSGTPLPDSADLAQYLKTLAEDPETVNEKGQWKEAIDKSPITHRAAYYKPYLMHAANGPSCAIAQYAAGKLKVWSHSQGIYPLRSALSELLHLPVDDIHIKGMPGSGCYGHNGADDVAAEAALLAMQYPDKPVRLQWMRDEEHGWEPYGSAMIMEVEAGLDSQGRIRGWKYDFWSDLHGTRPSGRAENLLPARYLGKGFNGPASGFRGGAARNSEPYYDIENTLIRSHFFSGPLRTSALRGLGAYANVFAIESFIDELAEKAGQSPLDFRKAHLIDPRAISCLEKLESKTVGVDVAKNEGLGYAFSRYKNTATYCAVAALVSVNRSTGSVQVKKMWAVVDAGETINPDGLKNQIEGGMVQSASWALKEAVTFDNVHITSLDWNRYPIFRYKDAPETEVEVTDRSELPPLGAGEAAQGPATAAITNAIFRATGVRIRSLPVNPELLREGPNR